MREEQRVSRLLAQGNALCAKGKYREAERKLLRALRLAESNLGARHIQVAWVLNSLGMTYKYLARYAAARLCYLRAVGILRKRFGPQHISLANLYHNLGGLEHARERFARRNLFPARGGYPQKAPGGAPPRGGR